MSDSVQITEKLTSPGEINSVKEEIQARFVAAQEKADAAWENAQTQLAELVTVTQQTPVDTEIDVAIKYDDGDVVNRILEDSPEKPDIDATSVDVDPPVFSGTLRDLPALDSVVSSLRSSLAAEVQRLVTIGATGLSAAVEDEIWERMRARNELENARIYTEAETYFSSRGFVLPPGALAGRLNEIGIEIVRNNTYINNDIAVEQARLAQTNQHWVLEKGVMFVVEDTRLVISSIIEHNKSLIDKYANEVEQYKQRLASKIALLDAQAKVYSSEATVYGARVQVTSADLDAQAKNIMLELERVKGTYMLRIKEAEINLDNLTKLHQLQLEAMRAGGQVAAQLAASALSSINATASMGFSGSGSISNNISESWDRTKETASGETTSNIHTFDETAEG